MFTLPAAEMIHTCCPTVNSIVQRPPRCPPRRSPQSKGNALVDAPSLLGVNQSRRNVSKQSATYSELHAENAPTELRVGRAQEMVNQYYDLATDFYE